MVTRETWLVRQNVLQDSMNNLNGGNEGEQNKTGCLFVFIRSVMNGHQLCYQAVTPPILT